MVSTIMVEHQPKHPDAIPHAVRLGLLAAMKGELTCLQNFLNHVRSLTVSDTAGTNHLNSIAPTFLLAANFVILGRITRIVGVQFSRLTPAACA